MYFPVLPNPADCTTTQEIGFSSHERHPCDQHKRLNVATDTRRTRQLLGWRRWAVERIWAEKISGEAI
ncbi:uncharacterized protein YALI1_B01344g [Yarrowia lipolytica]|uniref:Uncharacterized protein n=1 Tax=Yarrowia lipolytica TaxID=4952 RepID=A0A1D8N5W7_YARLL|nr:hypothetical protein YALI1_B01344g [Yarrowia lipolytica]